MQGSIEAQKAVIGCILLEPDTAGAIFSKLPPKCFMQEEIRKIYISCRARRKKGAAYDFVTLCSEYPDSKLFLADCMQTVVSTRHVDGYIQAVIDDYRKSLMLAAVVEIQSCENADEMADVLNDANSAQEKIRAAQTDGATAEFMDACIEYIESLGQKRDTGISTGFFRLDLRLGGLRKASYTVLAGRSGHGKTDFALNVALKVAKRGTRVLYLSMEMTREQLMDRIASNITLIDSMKIRDNTLSADEIAKIACALDAIAKKTKLFIDEGTNLTFADIEAKCLKFKPEILFIDHLGLVKGNKKTQWENQFEISQELRQLANRMGIAVFALVQQSSRAEKAKDKTAIMSDVKGTDGIANDADAVMFITADVEGEAWRDVKLQLTKNRNGENKPVYLRWNPQFHTYCEVEYEH